MYKIKVSWKSAIFFMYGFARYTLNTYLNLQKLDFLDTEVSKLDFSWKTFLKCLTNKVDMC